jgi:hypothetical protein
MAISGKSDLRGNRKNKRNPLPWVATSCRSQRMVRRGSTVRVRQRALQKPRKRGFFLSDAVAQSSACGGYGVRYGAFRSRNRFGRARISPVYPRAPSLATSISAEDDYLRVDVAHIAEVAAALRASQPKGGSHEALGHARVTIAPSAYPTRRHPPARSRQARPEARRPLPTAAVAPRPVQPHATSGCDPHCYLPSARTPVS